VTERRCIEEAFQPRQRLQTVGTIAGGVGHSFNNLLTIILGNIDVVSLQVPEPCGSHVFTAQRADVDSEFAGALAATPRAPIVYLFTFNPG
jgi:hypothetical protein